MGVEPKLVVRVAIRFLSGPLAEQTIVIQKPETTIGRDQQNDICVSDLTVSRRHAIIRYREGQWTIENLSQNSYVAINQQRMQQGVLADNSAVKIGGNVSFIFLFLDQQMSSMLQEKWSREFLKPIAMSLSTSPLERSVPDGVPRGRPNLAKATPFGTILAPHSELGMPSKPSLTISGNRSSYQELHYLSKSVISIGRDKDNDIVIPDQIFSGKHAQIVCEGNEVILIHPHPEGKGGGTLNGLLYRGKHIQGDQSFRQRLVHGDVFRVGSDQGTLITFSFDDGSDKSIEVVPELPPIPLPAGRLMIGRDPKNDVVLNHLRVSARHAYLEKMKDCYRIVDNNSTNHVYVNGQVVTDQKLRMGDEIHIGPYRFTYTGTELKQYDESSHIRIDAQNLRKVGNNSVILLNDISLAIPPRKLVALVGGSGAGKSTLMDALNGLRPAQEGTVTYNGIDYYNNLATFSTQLGYVPQDDIVHRELTVERALYYAACLRLSSDLTKEQIQWRINEVLEDVEMTERRNLLVSKLSGGQRKRVSIALELLANPGVFFLDEPTSGLDPGLDYKMMTLLRRLADRGHTVVLVTHATNNINICDYICFLAQGGRLAYFGPPNKAKEFFDKTDFVEIYSALEPTKEQPHVAAQAEASFRASSDYQQYVVEPLKEGQVQSSWLLASPVKRKGRQKAGCDSRGRGWLQFLLLSRRYLELLKNDPGNLLILLLQAPLIAIMLVLLVRFEIGAGIFDTNKLAQCRTQIKPSSGPMIVLPEAMEKGKEKLQVDCSVVEKFLKDKAKAKAGPEWDFIKREGGEKEALQEFLMPGFGADAQKTLFIMAFTTVMFGCINGTREIVKEVAIYRRERAVNLGILPYMFSKIVVLGILCLFQSAILTLIIQLGEPLKQGIFLSPILETYITLTLTSLAGLMIGLTVSAIAPNNDRAVSFVPIILLPQVIFSGAIIPLKDWFTQIVAVIFPTRWAMVALGSSIGLNAEKIGGDHLFGDDATYHGTLFSTFSQSDALNRLVLSWVALGVIIVVLMVVIGFFLKRKDIRE